MNNKLFHGYNCFSAVVGQHFLNIGREELLDSITIRWSFDFNPYLFYGKLWYVGTCVEPSDYLLQYDLQKYDNIKTIKYKTDRIKAEGIMTEELIKHGSHIIMIDFYYVAFWNKFQRFTTVPQHNPHFINIIGQTKDEIIYQDPLYNYCGKMDRELFFNIRNSTVRKIDIDYEYYQLEFQSGKTKYNEIDRLFIQFDRYLKQKQYIKIEQFGEAVFTRIQSNKNLDDKEWMYNAYNSLQSVIFQHLSMLKVITKIQVNLQQELKILVQEWTQIRKYFYNLYFNDALETAREIKELLYHIAEREQNFSNKLITAIGG